jgi:general secretion pathway protein G
MVGMTLIELLCGLAIVGILASVAYSSYGRHVERVRVSEAITGIASLQLALVRYANRPDRLGAGLPEDLSDLGLSEIQLTDPWGGRYQYAVNPRLNRDYDLYSLGRDGLTGASGAESFAEDDVVRGGNGAFVGLFSDYMSIPGTTSGQLAVTSGSDLEPTRTIDEKGVRFTR